MGSAAVQIAAAMGARPLGVASPDNYDYLRSLGAREVFDYRAADRIQQVRAAVPADVDLLLEAAVSFGGAHAGMSVKTWRGRDSRSS